MALGVDDEDRGIAGGRAQLTIALERRVKVLMGSVPVGNCDIARQGAVVPMQQTMGVLAKHQQDGLHGRLL